MKLSHPTSTKVFTSLESLLGLTQKEKSKLNSIVFTNGCFDLLHAGHLDYLEKTSQLGDFFVIGLNSDKSVSRLKGNDRPIISEMERAAVLASLGYVDAVIIFEEDTPQLLIESILPDVLVKGGDYKIENIVGAEQVINNGGQVETIEFVHQLSSSEIINKIKSL